jgi:branched-chain amino acid transport system ATP-binding protein
MLRRSPPVEPEPTGLAVDDLTAQYGRTGACLRGVTMHAPRGQIVALMGMNGAGKTSLARAVTGMLPYHRGRALSGEIRWQGRALTGLKPDQIVRAGISQTLEGRRIFPELTVEQNLIVGGFTRRNDATLRARRVEVLERFPRLLERRSQLAGLLSGGEQQMLAVGRALMQSPALLVLDEPSLGLAPKVVEQVREMIVSLRDAGVGVLLIEQNAVMALSAADYGYILSHGRVTKEGPAATLLADPEIQTFYLGLDR